MKMRCKHCGSSRVRKAGIEYAGKKKQRWLCKSCGRFTLTIIEMKGKKPANSTSGLAPIVTKKVRSEKA